eukprot:NODE_1235_length_1041_cov_194.218750_g946_i0.p1 GENE.NODE_1235_length_1041_cov_194.218750_g946_i0~~NODE_1235_length_1041_cov_194.218750_g946_i0.p1  ORF type:complete len:286 (-),score=32.32 NODE_1235_length_1041_cov_194.218750_g946_i0:133-990(-)
MSYYDRRYNSYYEPAPDIHRGYGSSGSVTRSDPYRNEGYPSGNGRDPSPRPPTRYPRRDEDFPAPTAGPGPVGGIAIPKLYVNKLSANCMGPWILLREANIHFELMDVQMQDCKSADFLSMNPMGKVPTYMDSDGSVIWESNSIMRFICEKHNVDERFFPHESNLRGRIEMALDWRQTVLYPDVANVAYPALGWTQDKSKINEGKLALDKHLKILTDFFLRETPFIGGALPCIADYAIGLLLLYLYRAEYRVPTKVRAYVEELAHKTPSWNEVTNALNKYTSNLR